MVFQTLYQQCIKQGVTFFDEFHMVDLILEDGECRGIVALEIATGHLHVFHAKSVLLATGGFGRMFKVSSNAYALTGDGPAIAYRRGIPLKCAPGIGPSESRCYGTTIRTAVRE